VGISPTGGTIIEPTSGTTSWALGDRGGREGYALLVRVPGLRSAQDKISVAPRLPCVRGVVCRLRCRPYHRESILLRSPRVSPAEKLRGWWKPAS